MGLIGNVLQPLYIGAPCILMSLVHFLQKPVRWVSAISRSRATTSGGPNFSYELCARQVSDAQRADLDLRSWTVAFNGAEPVRAATINVSPIGLLSAVFGDRPSIPVTGWRRRRC